jgi:hypothetical protein
MDETSSAGAGGTIIGHGVKASEEDRKVYVYDIRWRAARAEEDES